MQVTVIGAGLAGSEAAWQLAQRGLCVRLCEMKPEKKIPAHESEYFAELCCTNSLRSDQLENAVGLLKEELRRLDSLILRCARAPRRVPAGRRRWRWTAEGFAKMVTESVCSHPNIEVVPGEVTEIPEGEVLIATGPLTSDAFAEKLLDLLGRENTTLNFFDAAAPLLSFDSVDMDSARILPAATTRERRTISTAPWTRDEYLAFWQALTDGGGGGGPRLRG
ncbi:MAG: FAD-dependent oxidoreductase [Oscillospiraceae bacterium]